MRNRLERRKQQIDPKTLRKHSSFVAKGQDDLKIVGDRVQTDYGFTISGFTGKFETFFMCIMPTAVTPVWKHEKKTRVYRVNSGVGYYMVWDNTSDNATSKQVIAGDEIVIEAGVKHMLGTTGASKLELFVTQESKYAAHLVEIEPSTPVEVPAEYLEPVSEDGRFTFGQQRRSGSRAAEQIAQARGQNPGRDRRRNGPDVDTFMRGGAAGVNAMPVSNFDAEGAG